MNNKFLNFIGLAKRAGKVLLGYNKCEEHIKKNPTYLVLVSVDASSNTKDKFKGYCERSSIPYMECYSSMEIGKSVGRAEINVLCITDKNMAVRLLEIDKSLKIIGGEDVCQK